MAKMKWTAAQRAAMDDRGGSLLVSAAAGSGKTAVLTERVVELLRDVSHPIEADRLLIVTFTNAAAAELRARIALRLEQVLLEHPSDNRLRRQKMLLQRAHICTIDAFCLHLLQRHFTALDLPPDFGMADVGVVGRLKQQALAETLEEAYQDAHFCAFANLYGKGRSDGATSAALLQVYDFLRTLPFPSQTMADALAQWHPDADLVAVGWHAILQAKAISYIDNGLRFARSALTLCEEDCEQAKAEAVESKKTAAAQDKAVAKVVDKYSKIFGCLEGLIDAFSAAKPWANDLADWDALYQSLSPYRLGTQPMPGLKNSKVRLNGANGARAKQEGDKAGDWFAALVKLIPADHAQEHADRETAYPMIAALFHAQEQFAERFYQKKIEKKMLEFADLEHLTLALLDEEEGKRTPLAQSISGAFDAIMVDEYQDTNALQEEIYRRLANEAGDNLFYVGDLKQSIYRFRQADPSIFAHKLATFTPLVGDTARPRPNVAQGEVGTDALLTLDANFRSAPAVVEGINFLFEEVMQGGLGGVSYGDGQRLVCASGDVLEGKVGLLLDTVGENDPVQIASKIAELVALGAQNHPEGMVRDGSALRAVRYEDCCILLSTRAPFGKYVDALTAQGIPSYADTAEDLLSTRHIQPLVALLTIIDNPSQDIPLATAMRSVLFGFTDDDLLTLRVQYPHGSLYGKVLQAANSAHAKVLAGEQPDPFGQKIMAFYESLAQMRRLSHTLSPEELLAEIFATTHYLALVGAMEQGTRRRQEVSKFVAYATMAGANGIEALVHNMEQTMDSGGLVDTAPGRVKAGCVTIMTIHRSKGLQFPVVFAANLDHRFNTDDLKRKILLHREYGLGLQLRAGEDGNNYQTVASLALREITKQELLSEEMRLLYVVLTRAQDMLYLSGSVKGLAKRLPEIAFGLEAGAERIQCSEATSFLDWVLIGLMRHPSCGALRADLEDVAIGRKEAVYPITVELFDGGSADENEDVEPENMEPEDIADAEQIEEIETAVLPMDCGLTQIPDATLVATYRNGFAWQYPYAHLTDLPAKVSVTSLVHQEQGTLLSRPAFLAKDGMTAAEKGTALHAFLEHADFAVLKNAQMGGTVCLKQALRAEQIRLEKEQRILPELAEQLDMARVELFFAGDAFARIAAASEIYREYPFITGLPADEVITATAMVKGSGQVVADAKTPSLSQNEAETAHDITDKSAENHTEQVQEATVLVQGIADLVLVFSDHLELLDYKSDHGKNEESYRNSYAKQLAYYARAIEKRFAPLTVTYKAIYSFDLNRLIEV